MGTHMLSRIIFPSAYVYSGKADDLEGANDTTEYDGIVVEDSFDWTKYDLTEIKELLDFPARMIILSLKSFDETFGFLGEGMGDLKKRIIRLEISSTQLASQMLNYL